jgi:hypothetical protein
MLTGIIGLIVFIFDLAAIASIIKSPAATGAKILWSLLIIALPLLGLIIWYLAGPKKGLATA